MIQVRNVPEKLHRKLKARAALAGMSLSEYLLSELRRVAERPTRQELLERLRQRAPFEPVSSPAEAVRAERDAR
jgi:plasmid stability protein